MATPNNNNASEEEKIDPMKDVRAGIVREVGSQAIWSLSSCKPGFGVDQLRDDCMETYWQSDGQLPHLVNIQFRRKTVVRDICIYIDYRLDESYTPGRISVRAGTNFNDLQEVEVVELNEPYGWIAVITNHQNGRDTHMRQIKVHSPVEKRDLLIGNFSTVEMRQYTIIK
ncbi:anaphase-promoting complex subunit 10 isoform X2 [Aphis gossypii]|uniref:anaphase-promoting complex subunit 10 isoform X2 n=1 Tax=Aphis gossypii TaxID=80765 RepID=UPI00100E9483|nr:anaphase-promoting complex subunit 10 isoform X2 [Aphis gossypii]